MTATTQHAAIEALVAMWSAAVDVPVYDGPNAIENAPKGAVWVGYDPTAEDGEAVSTSQDWAELGAQNRSKDETGTITCAAAAWSGDSNTQPRRVAVAQLLTDLETAHRADVTLGGAVMYSNFAAGNLHQQLTADGNEVLALFTVTFRSRI